MRIIIISLFLTVISFCYCGAQIRIPQNYVFDYFREEQDSTVFVVGSAFLMPGDSLSFIKNEYTIDSSNTALKIYFKNRLLYSYDIHNNKIEGMGYCYYPFLGRVALQGQLKNSKLDGLVFIQRPDGSMIEVMWFKNGIYQKHIYH